LVQSKDRLERLRSLGRFARVDVLTSERPGHHDELILSVEVAER
jgi:hypothetical protein